MSFSSRHLALLATAGAAIAIASPASAQDAPDIDGEPYSGTVRLDSGFLPDPDSHAVQSGGNFDASALGGQCVGYISTRPDLRLRYNASSALPLIIAAGSVADTTLVVNAPDGRWYCNDDALDLNPQLIFDDAMSGDYDIWVGTYGSSQVSPGTVFISELDMAELANSIMLASLEFDAGADLDAEPTYATLDLASGFANDPRRVEVQSGGDLDAEVYGGACYGFIARAPDVRVNYEAGGMLPLIFGVQSDADTTLAVRAPDGYYYCNDDGGEGTDPRIELRNPASGGYDVFVGTFGGPENYPATLLVSELASAMPSDEWNAENGDGVYDMANSGTRPDDGARPDWSADPTYGEVTLNAGFTPDPFTDEVVSGGSFDASRLGGNCAGAIAIVPDYRLNYTAGDVFPLSIAATSEGDTTIAINAPDGEWYCDDDGGGFPNPKVTFSSPMSGQYDIFVGSYDEDENHDATLVITEVE